MDKTSPRIRQSATGGERENERQEGKEKREKREKRRDETGGEEGEMRVQSGRVSST